ncbi:DUF6471 domain-containing protein [Accumulibacter sp.]|uniref:DUF6471 domain-containing protein n=1 Tax=Accumulibacter sp. TaxID=2053492 RepID=UPI001ACEA6E0|nr:DUF6471 domain-containing protein [Accumulibacter sp.]MBN8498509.1 hypothetical protein [Accumulibacter sp.]
MNKPGRRISVGVRPEATRSESVATEMWGLQASVVLKRAMRERGWGYSELSEALKPLGIKRSAAVINRRINRGNFNAGFLLACLQAMRFALDVRREER